MSDVVIARMSYDEALECVGAIRSHLDTAIVLVKRLIDGEGWRALNYSSVVECLQIELRIGRSHAYRLKDMVALVEVLQLSPVGENVPTERALRPIAELPESVQRIAYQIAKQEAAKDGTDTPTERHTKPVAAVFGEIVATGGFVSLEGVATPLDAALTENQFETLMRQREVLNEHTARKYGTPALHIDCFLEGSAGIDTEHQALTIYIHPSAAPGLLNAVREGATLTLTARKKD